MAFFLPALKREGRLDHTHFTICTIGSRKGDTYTYGRDLAESDTWNILAPNLTIYGFEADQDGCAQANALVAARNIPWTEKHFPVGLWKTSARKTLYITKNLYGSSLFEPSPTFIERHAFTDWIEVIRT